MTKNEFELAFRAVRSMTLFASEIREELDEAVACAVWGDSDLKSGEDLRKHLTGLVEDFVGSYERVRQATRRNE